MREILFRGKRVDNDKWVEGDYTDNKFDEPSIWNDGYAYEINDSTVGQYTGIKDINGTKVFEGDVLKCRDSYDEIYYETEVQFDGAFSVEVIGCDYEYTSLIFAEDNDDIINFEVIGNKYDK